jgi:SAM-dependent methyltransferase
MGEENSGPEAFQDLTRRLAEQPDAWPEVREGVRRSFDGMARDWESIVRPDHIAPLEAALDRVEHVTRALDLGTGTGLGARSIAERFTDAWVAGIDLAEEMVREAVGRTAEGRIRYLVGDGSALPFANGVFDLITAVNVFVFWEEVTRVLAPGGTLAIEYSSGEETPIYLPVPDVKRHLSVAGSYAFEDGRAGRGIWLLARKRSAA